MAAPPFTVSAKAVNLVAEISALIERYALSEENAHEVLLRRANRVKTIHSSLAIEGNLLSETEVHDIIIGKNVIAPPRQIQEVKNAICVYDEYTNLNPFSENDLRRAHAIMMESLIDDAGRYRSNGVGVFGETGLVHLAPPPAMVPPLMSDLFAWLASTEDHLLIRSCVFHYEFEIVHPFSDGNGRMGRLWQSLILGRLHPLFEFLPIENMVYANQDKYYAAIAASSKLGNSAPFIDFMLTEILKTLKNHRDKEVPNKIPNKVPNKSELRVLAELNGHPHLTRTLLAERTGISENGIKKILASLKRNGWIERHGSNKTGYWRVVYNLV